MITRLFTMNHEEKNVFIKSSDTIPKFSFDYQGFLWSWKDKSTLIGRDKKVSTIVGPEEATLRLFTILETILFCILNQNYAERVSFSLFPLDYYQGYRCISFYWWESKNIYFKCCKLYSHCALILVFNNLQSLSF